MTSGRDPRWTTVLLDRDGVINRMRPDYVKGIDELELLPGSIDAMASLSREGYQVVIVTNQSAIGQGIVSASTVDEINKHLERLVAERGGVISGFLICPHRRDEGCDCRKPAPGLIFRARDEFGADLSRTVLVGDQDSDVQAAQAAGCDAILIRPETANGVAPGGCRAAASLAEAVELIRAA